MKCATHEDQTVIMVCQTPQCQTCLVCVLCIAGEHRGHAMATLEEVGKASKKGIQDKSTENIKYIGEQQKQLERINSMEQAIERNQNEAHNTIKTQGQRMHEAVDKALDHMILQCYVKYEERMEKLKDKKDEIKDAIATVRSSQEGLEQILETEDWLKIIQHEKKPMTLPKVEDFPKDITPGIGAEEINKTLMTGILSALQQCEPNTIADEHTSDFEGTVYRHKSLECVFSIPLSEVYSITCIAPDHNDTSWVIINKEIKLCNKQNIIEKNIEYKKKIRGIVITELHYLFATCTDERCVKKISFSGKEMNTFSTDPLIPNQICVANNGDILVTLVSSFTDPLPETVGAVSRYTSKGKRMITFERDRFGHTICPKYIAASRVSDMVVITTHTNNSSDGWFHGHVIVMTGDLQVKFRYLSDGQVIPGDQQYHTDVSTKHFSVGIDSQDNIVLGDIKSGSIEIIDKQGHKLQYLGQVDGISFLTISSQDELWIGKTSGQVDVFKYT